jgi:hypothetical protein
MQPQRLERPKRAGNKPRATLGWGAETMFQALLSQLEMGLSDQIRVGWVLGFRPFPRYP